MNRKTEIPEVEFIRFDAADVIATSGGPMDGEGPEGTSGYGGVTDLGGGGIGQPLQ